jgi:hypothetical protein
MSDMTLRALNSQEQRKIKHRPYVCVVLRGALLDQWASAVDERLVFPLTWPIFQSPCRIFPLTINSCCS